MQLNQKIDEFLSNAYKITSPAVTLTYADVEGNIGFYGTGILPIRKN